MVTRVDSAGNDCAAIKVASAVSAVAASWIGTRVSWIITPSSADKAFIPSRCLRVVTTVVIDLNGAGTPHCQPAQPLARVSNSRQRKTGQYRRLKKRHPRRRRQRISRYSPCTIIVGKTNSGRVKARSVAVGTSAAGSTLNVEAVGGGEVNRSSTWLGTIC